MTNWTVERVDTNPTGGDVELTCLSGETPYKVTLRDRDTGNVSVTTLCVNPAIPPCHAGDGLLAMLTGAGYTPADWDEECS